MSAVISEYVDHDDMYDAAGMKEAVVASHNQDTISAVHKKIERLFKFFVSHGCMRFATLIRILSVAAIRPVLCVQSLYEFE